MLHHAVQATTLPLPLAFASPAHASPRTCECAGPDEEQRSAWVALDRDVADLMDHVASGCTASFQRLYEQTSPHLMAVVNALVPNADDPRVVLQTLFVDIWEQRAEHGGPARKGMNWLVAMTRRGAIDSGLGHLPRAEERRATQTAHVSRANDDRELLAQSSPHAVRQCLCTLAAGPREALTLAFHEGLSPVAIADRLGQDTNTIKFWLRTAMTGLRR